MKKITLYFVILTMLTSCRSCSKSGRQAILDDARTKTEATENESIKDDIGKATVKMKKLGGVYQIPIKINGMGLYFIFDTGASDITISLAEAITLQKQGLLSQDDIKGSQQYQIADGSIHEGVIINLKTVQIGQNTLHNIQASVVDNMKAPLLLGQSALAKFGKVSIDYNKEEISFE